MHLPASPMLVMSDFRNIEKRLTQQIKGRWIENQKTSNLFPIFLPKVVVFIRDILFRICCSFMRCLVVMELLQVLQTCQIFLIYGNHSPAACHDIFLWKSIQCCCASIFSFTCSFSKPKLRNVVLWLLRKKKNIYT